MENLVQFVCPRCKSELNLTAGSCSTCGLPMSVDSSGILTVAGAMFRDHDHAAAQKAFDEGRYDYYSHDEQVNIRFINDFTTPLLDRVFPRQDRSQVRILSVGCGVGIDIEMLIDMGYDAWGADCGSRCLFWPNRKYPNRLTRCMDDTLPFPNAHFDFVMAHQVLEHVGVVGDSMELAPDWKDRRQRFLSNLLQVTKPGGFLNVATPNRLFPIDPGHAPNFWGIRVHGPFDRFLTSYGDMNRYFNGHNVKALSPLGYYTGTSCATRGRVGKSFLAYQKILDRIPFLQASLFNPLANVLVQRSPQAL
jgi:SAM-dependent methyltransferase